MKHTPAPWHITPPLGGLGKTTFSHAIIGLPGIIAKVAALGEDSAAVHESSEANARLIAAAPDLLRACRDTLEFLTLLAHNGREGRELLTYEDRVRLWRTVREATDKAEGVKAHESQ